MERGQEIRFASDVPIHHTGKLCVNSTVCVRIQPCVIAPTVGAGYLHDWTPEFLVRGHVVTFIQGTVSPDRWNEGLTWPLLVPNIYTFLKGTIKCPKFYE